MEIRPSGDAGLLVDCADLAEAMATYAAIRVAVAEGRVPGVVDVVPAARSVLLALDPDAADPVAAADALERIDPHGETVVDPSDAEVLEVPVTYDGEDLAEVAEILGCAPADVANRHSSGLWTVAFSGFAPGFGYLTAQEGEWAIPRRESPRTRVPAGAVALAGEFTGVYPRESPGGWRLIGYTEVRMFDLDREPPALLAPGRRVRFVDAGRR